MDFDAPITLTTHEFIRRWKPVALTERAAAHAHFLDLCSLFGHKTPIEADPKGEIFAFEKGLVKVGGGGGFADVWKQHFFAWEYKKKKRDLGAALEQLTRYASALDNPPLHVVCDTVRFRIETRWTNTVTAVHEFELEQLADPEKFALLRAVFHDPESLRPKQTRASLTREAADKFQTISDRLQHRNPDREAVAHFINQLVFCFFANSVKLLPEGLLRKLIDTGLKRPGKAKDYFDKLFAQMESGGEFDLTEIKHFNGGLFDGRRALHLEPDELGLLRALHSFRWDLIDPTIFGTLFERFLDPDKRAQIGAHYTDPDKIMLIVEPVVMRPLRREWDEARARIAGYVDGSVTPPMVETTAAAGAKPVRRRLMPLQAAEAVRDAFIERLCGLSILDPACGSGNFLYLALQAVKDLEWKALLECETLGLGRPLPRVGPRILHGIEINPLAAELARTVIWIGDIQWGIANGLTHRPEPILEKLDAIECRDALVDWGGASLPSPPGGEGEGKAPIEALWPPAEFIIGNPPFLGASRMLNELSDDYVRTLRRLYAGRVPGFSDFVCWWFSKATDQVLNGSAKRVGLVATNSIRGGVNRTVLDRIADQSKIFEAYSDEPWINEGAAVRVSIICFGCGESVIRLDCALVNYIPASLQKQNDDLTSAKRLSSNVGRSFLGVKKGGKFDIGADIARLMLTQPLNVNVKGNWNVLRPRIAGSDIVQRSNDEWIIDFTRIKSEADAMLFEQPYAWIAENVKPTRVKNRRQKRAENWWLFSEISPSYQLYIAHSARYIATPRVAKYRIFIFLDSACLIDDGSVAIARDDDTSFGILHSRFHEAWSLRLGTWLGVGNDPRYTPTTTFETFPFPEGLTPNLPAASYVDDPRAIRIAAAAKLLDERRRAWLNPPDLVEIVPEIMPTAAPGEEPRRYPDRILPRNVEAAVKLKDRTLTNLYNQRPAWLIALHADLDRAVAAAYGWPEDIANDEALARLLALNLERAAAGR